MAYPFTKRLLEPHWESLLTEYMETFPARSFRRITLGKQFPVFLESKRIQYHFPAALPELALFEWMEADMVNAPEADSLRNILEKIPTPKAPTIDELPYYCPVLNPFSRLVQFHYPIPSLCMALSHLSANDLAGSVSRCDIEPAETWVMGYLQSASGEYQYSVQTPFMALWLQSAGNVAPGEITYRDSLKPLMDLLGMTFEGESGFYETFLEAFLASLQNLLDFGILAGSVPAV
jgi:hypothetical protein